VSLNFHKQSNVTPKTVQGLLLWGRQTLGATSDAPDIDSQQLLLRALRQSEPSWLYTHGDELVSEAAADMFALEIAARKQGKPLAYILGEAHFMGRAFFVNEHVLIPRPETEDLVSQAIAIITRDYPTGTIADIGTGSGCIAITLALALPDIQIVATDISTEALAVARRNAKQHAVFNRIDFLHGDMLAPLHGRPIDFIVSNPPYVPTAEIDQASNNPETYGLTFEPRGALDGGPTGDQFVSILKQSGIPAILETRGGAIVLI
jgi:release factor glutamine methyltransferase